MEVIMTIKEVSEKYNISQDTLREKKLDGEVICFLCL